MIDIANYKKETEQELQNILAYWMKHSVDEVHGGFYGKIDNANNVYANAPKGCVLNSRILWTFSAAYLHTRNNEHLEIAERAFNYIANHFIDKTFGGVYWSVDHTGKPLDTKKQIYAHAFAVYGLSEYYRAGNDEKARDLAIEVYKAMEQYSHDKQKLGYIEALTRDWDETNDSRLSAKDSNEKKGMNTHLHVLEAYANLYRAWPDEGLKQNIVELINLFLDRIIDAETNHLVVFFDEDWNPKTDIVSYGHDIEAAWLVQEAAEVIGDEDLINKVKHRSVKVAIAAERGLDKDGGLWYEKDISENHLIKEKHWWPQAEAMVGFLNAWQITKGDQFLNRSVNSWKFIQNHLLDKKNGEWFWGVKENYSIMEEQDKVGLWKCPYHNGRACLEIIRRTSTQ